MIRKGIIDAQELSSVEKTKIEFFKKIKTDKLNAISVIFSNTAPSVVQQAALFIQKLEKPTYDTAIDGVFRSDNYVLVSYEYLKRDNNYILYLEFKVDKKQGVEFTKLDPDVRIAIARIDNRNYLAYEKSEKVFIISNGFSGPFGYIDLERLNSFMDKLEDKWAYKLSNLEVSAYLADNPYGLFQKDTTYYRDGDNLGFWISFGTLFKVDNINFNNINIDGIPVALVDINLDTSHVFRKLLEAKSKGYIGLLLDKEKMLSYLLKEAKNYILEAKKQDLNRVCIEDLLKNVEEKGLLGIVYEEVKSLSEIYIPAFDYTEAKVKDVVGKGLLFIYQDEYIYMHYNGKEIDFFTYKGDVYEFEDANLKVKIYPEPALTKVNKVNNEGFVLFTGFENLEVNNILDIYFDNAKELLSSKNAQYAIDVKAFDTYYNEATKSFNGLFYDDKEVFRTYGTNKYAFTTGLIHYNPTKVNGGKAYELSVSTMPSIASIIDAYEKRAHLNALMLSNYGFVTTNLFRADLKNFIALVEVIANEVANYPLKDDVSIQTNMLNGISDMTLFRNGYFTFKDAKTNKYITLFASTDKYRDFMAFDFLLEAKKRATNEIKQISSMRPLNKADIETIAKELKITYDKYMDSLIKEQLHSLMGIINKKVKVSSSKDRFEFEKVSDNIYVNNRPNTEIASHALLFEDNFQKALKSYYEDTPVGKIKSEYIMAAKLKETDEGYYIEARKDLSDKTNLYLFRDLGISAAYMPERMRDDVLKFEPKLLVKYLSKREINGEVYDLFLMRAGYKLDVDFSQLEAKAKELLKTPNHQDYGSAKSELNYYEELKKEAIQREVDRKYKNLYAKEADNEELKTAIDNTFAQVGMEVYVAYKEGKVLVSIGGQEFFEPFVTPNGLRLNLNLYVRDYELFDVSIKNMVLSDVAEMVYDGIEIEDDMIDLQQVKVHNIFMDRDFKKAVVLFEFADIQGVVNGLLYNKGELVSYEVELDVDVDYIKDNKRIVFLDIPVEYTAIYPIDTNKTYSNAEEILNNENAFLVIHHIPIALGLDSEGYMYETKTDAIKDGIISFVNFTKGEKNV